jgi:hypothetical protein
VQPGILAAEIDTSPFWWAPRQGVSAWAGISPGLLAAAQARWLQDHHETNGSINPGGRAATSALRSVADAGRFVQMSVAW